MGWLEKDVPRVKQITCPRGDPRVSLVTFPGTVPGAWIPLNRLCWLHVDLHWLCRFWWLSEGSLLVVSFFPSCPNKLLDKVYGLNHSAN